MLNRFKYLVAAGAATLGRFGGVEIPKPRVPAPAEAKTSGRHGGHRTIQDPPRHGGRPRAELQLVWRLRLRLVPELGHFLVRAVLRVGARPARRVGGDVGGATPTEAWLRPQRMHHRIRVPELHRGLLRPVFPVYAGQPWRVHHAGQRRPPRAEWHVRRQPVGCRDNRDDRFLAYSRPIYIQRYRGA